MKHHTIESARKGLIIELQKLLTAHENEIVFQRLIVTVSDPYVDTDFGSGQVGIEKLVFDTQTGEVLAHGAPYEEDCVARGDSIEPLDVKVLQLEEIDALLAAAGKSVGAPTP